MLYYRGQSKRFPVNPLTGNDLTPSLFRGKDLKNFSLKREAEYYRNLFDFLKEPLNLGISPEYHALGKLQHYSVPTRLLDITADKNVATYFACSGHFDEEGYVYRIDDGADFYDLKSDLSKAVTRKFTTLMKAKDFIENNIDLNAYFQKEDNTKFIRSASITKAVILNYALIFRDESIENIRYNRQKGSFILFGNKVDVDKKSSALFLRDEINLEALNNLQAERIPAAVKLSELERLATEKGMHYVYFFPDESVSLRLTAKYNEIFHLADEATGMEILKNFIVESFPTQEHEFSEYKNFRNYLIENVSEIHASASKNPDSFYFIFRELQAYYLYLKERKRDIQDAREVIRKIAAAA